jgi:hypothetical protein
MTIDYTKLLAKLNPEPGGEDVLRLRTGKISAVNSDGTVDVAISGVVVPDVPRLASSVLSAASNVQVLSYRGSLLVIDAIARNGNVQPMVDSGVVAGVTIAASAPNRAITTVSFNRVFTTTPTLSVNFLSGNSNLQHWVIRPTAVTLTSFSAILEAGAAGVIMAAGGATFDVHWIAVSRP